MADTRLATAAQQAVQQQQENAGQTMTPKFALSQDWVIPAVQKALGPGMDGGSYVRSVLTAITKAPDLNKCDLGSIMGGMFTAAQLRLQIGSGLGQAYLIPRKDRASETGWSASFQVGYPGLVRLAFNSQMVTGVDALRVYEGDEFDMGADYERGKYFTHKAADDDRNQVADKLLGVIGLVYIKGTQRPQWRWLSRTSIENRRPDYTRASYHKGPWVTNYEAMADKTGVIEALKFAPKSVDLGIATAMDEAVITRTRDGELTARHDDHQGEEVIDPTGPPEPAPQPVREAARTAPVDDTPPPAPDEAPPPADQGLPDVHVPDWMTDADGAGDPSFG
jgi:recombination protein RecT